MSQSFSVNGKEYLQSNVLAVSLGYTADYIGKLAREEKILGTQVGRQWFIEPESLKIYLQKAQIEKEIRKAELSSQRKKEHEVHQTKHKANLAIPSASLAGAQAFAIIVCGLFVGGLSWVITAEGLGVQEIARGLYETKSLIAQSFAPTLSPMRTVETLEQNRNGFLAVSSEGIDAEVVSAPSISAPKRTEIFAQLPTFTDATSTSKTATSSSITHEIIPNLSDEVEVVVDDVGNEFLKPVFRSQSSSTALFMLVPFKEKEN